MKLDAWVDRSIDHQYKDADDLLIAFDWFRESPDYLRRIYDGSPSAAERWDWDTELACLWLLGADVARTIGSANTTFIAEKWNEASRVALARHIGKLFIGSNRRKSVHEVQALASGLESFRVAE